LSAFIIVKPALYDGLRQLLFLVPPMILLAVYGFINLFSYLIEQKQKIAVIGLVTVVLATQLQSFKNMKDLHPYEYMYFSPLVWGCFWSQGPYEMDYWGLCYKPSAEWLAHHYRKYTKKLNPTVKTSFDASCSYALLTRDISVNYIDPDFYITMTRFGLENKFSSYKVIHSEGIHDYVHV